MAALLGLRLLSIAALAALVPVTLAAEDCSISFQVTDAAQPGTVLDGVLYAPADASFKVSGVLSIGEAAGCGTDFSTWTTDFSALVPEYSVCPSTDCGPHQRPDPITCKCMCEDGWTGTDCARCESDDVCQAFTGYGKSKCEKSGLYSGYTVNKTMDCEVKDFAGGMVNHVRCDVLGGTCHSVMGFPSSSQNGANEIEDPMLECFLSDCTFYTSSFICRKQECEGLISVPSGTYTGKCDAAGNCKISAGDVTLEATCVYGDCTQEERIPISDQTQGDDGEQLTLGEVIVVTLAVGCAPVLLFYLVGVFSGLGFLKRQDTMLYRATSKLFPLDVIKGRRPSDKSVATTTSGAAATGAAGAAGGTDGAGQGSPDEGMAIEMTKLAPQVSAFSDESVFRQSLMPAATPLSRKVSDTDTFCLEFRNVTVKSHDGILLLNNVSGIAESRSVLGILGPSGAGKSTLIHSLVNRPATGTEAHGEISIDGRPMGPWYQAVCAFVPQEDMLFPTLTVRETLRFAALMKLPDTMKKQQKENIVDSLLLELGLAHVADVRVGDHTTKGISGGERRRLTIAAEIVTGPRVVVLDEPTSGLDSKTAENVMSTLAFLASANRVVICSIHQPSQKLFGMLGRCMFLANGQSMYHGPSKELEEHLRAAGVPCPVGTNIAEHVLECISEEYGRQLLLSHYRLHPPKHMRTQSSSLAIGWLEEAEQKAEASKRSCKNPLPALLLLLQRQYVHNLRHPSLFRLHLLVSLIGGVVTGILFFDVENTFPGFQNRIGALFFCLCFFSFCALSALPSFAQQWQIVLRESKSKAYGLWQYLVGAVAVDLFMLRFLPACVFCAIFYPMMGLRRDVERFLFFLAVIGLTNLVAGGFMMLFSAFMRDASAATLVASICLLISLLFGGLFLNAETMADYLEWLQLLSYFWYGYEALCVNELQGLMIRMDLEGVGSAMVLGDLLLLNIGMDIDNKARNCYVLLGYGLGLYVLSWVGLCLQSYAEMNYGKYIAYFASKFGGEESASTRNLKSIDGSVRLSHSPQMATRKSVLSALEESKSSSFQMRDSDIVTSSLAL